MPYRQEWVAPDLVVVVNGLGVWRAYKDANWDEPESFWYRLDPEDEWESDFDIRNLPSFNEGRDHADVLTEAVAAGALKLTCDANTFGQVPKKESDLP